MDPKIKIEQDGDFCGKKKGGMEVNRDSIQCWKKEGDGSRERARKAMQ